MTRQSTDSARDVFFHLVTLVACHEPGFPKRRKAYKAVLQRLRRSSASQSGPLQKRNTAYRDVTGKNQPNPGDFIGWMFFSRSRLLRFDVRSPSRPPPSVRTSNGWKEVGKPRECSVTKARRYEMWFLVVCFGRIFCYRRFRKFGS